MTVRLALLSCVVGVSALAQSPGAFTATGSMTTARFFHTATLLIDGRVLITGGGNFDKPLATGELYDPSTGVFTPTGDMTTARSNHSDTLLPDGQVLITGGGNLFAASAELYHPSTGTFTGIDGTTTVGSIATLLKNGEVLITGNKTAELYNPVSDRFAPTGSYVGPFYYGPYFYQDTDTSLPDGRVLSVGSACGDCWLEHEEIYDPVTGTFKVTGKLHTFDSEGDIGSGHTATLLPNGEVLLAGGVGNFNFFSAAELYDPSTDTFTATAKMTTARDGHTATLLPDGTVLVAGGQFYSNLISAELYNPSTGTFAATANMTMARAEHRATLLPDGRVLLSGGVGDSGHGLASAEIYTPPVLVPAPALFSVSGDGKGQGAILHANTPRVASSTDPAMAGEFLEIYLTGLADGSVIPPQVSIGGRMTEVVYFGKSGYTGVNQVDVRVPSGVVPGPAVPVRLTYIGRSSNEVTIGVQ